VEISSTVSQDPLQPYRNALKSLADAVEKTEALRGIEADLRSQAARLEVDRETALDQASETEDEANAEQLSFLSSRLEICRRKIANISSRVSDAETELAQELTAVSLSFRALHGHFYRWHFQKECDQARARLVDNAGQLFVEQCALLSRATASIKALELTATDHSGLRAQAVRLMESVERAEGFQIPLYTPPAPIAAPSASAAPAEPLVEYIFFDPCDPAVFDTGAEMRALAKDPGVTLQNADAKFQEKFPPQKFPHLYKTRADLLKMNESLIPPETGVTWTKVPMEGDTFVPEQERFIHA
jgi:hypothetical protein